MSYTREIAGFQLNLTGRQLTILNALLDEFTELEIGLACYELSNKCNGRLFRNYSESRRVIQEFLYTQKILMNIFKLTDGGTHD